MSNKQKKRSSSSNEQERYLKEKRQASVRSLYFNRFLFIRYSLAIFFFANMLLTLAGFPDFCALVAIALLLLSLRPLWLLGTANGKKEIPMKSLQLYVALQTFWIVGALCQCLAGNVSDLFPFLNNTSTARTFILCLLSVGLVLAMGCVWKVITISKQSDRTLQKIRFFEAKYHLD